MSNQPDVIVRLDDRLRLISAALAATNFPEQSQQRKAHGTHAHARSTRKYVAEYASHPAIQALQNLIDQNAPLEAVFTLALHLNWPTLDIAALPRWVPPGWNKQLFDFYQKTNLAEWWQKEKEVWDKSVRSATNVFQVVHFKAFLKPFLGEIAEDFVFIPNISYPTDQEVGIRFGKEVLCITPPPLAWGDSPPWPYDEDTMLTHSYRAALTQYGRILLMTYLRSQPEKLAEAQKNEMPVGDQFAALHPTWEDQFISLFVAAAVAMYLEDYVNDAEAKSYILMERKARGMTILPGTVSVLRRYMQEVGNKYESLLDFLPLFPKQLRIAKKIVTL